MELLLPATTYQPPPRQVRGTVLNTIMEERQDSTCGGDRSESDSDATVIGRPIYLDVKQFGAVAQPWRSAATPSPSSAPSSGTSSAEDWQTGRPEFNDLYDASDNETEFSDSCPSLRDSLSSRPTSFATDSTRNSVGSTTSGRNRYPAILIPSNSMWSGVTSPSKNSPVPPTPPPKIPVSPAALSLLPRSVPAIYAPPSLDGSLTSDQISNLSAPVTPDMHNLMEGDSWGRQPIRVVPEPDSLHETEGRSEPETSELDIVIEEPEGWARLVGNFPRIPETIPEDPSPILPNFPEPPGASGTPSESGVMLPSGALATLLQLDLDPHYDMPGEKSALPGGLGEMEERPIPPVRPKSADGITPASALSEYSFSQLSIPSPGGFFSSLGAGVRHTWYPGKTANPPSSATAENFYNCPWNEPERIVEQVIQVEDDDESEGPETARRIVVDGPPTARRTTDGRPLTDTSVPKPPVVSRQSFSSSIETVQEIPQTEIRYEYEDAYETELRQAASTNLDRTSIWLAAQASYLSVLRETNPVNDLENNLPSKTRLSKHEKKDSLDSPVKKVVRFLEEVAKETEESHTSEAHKKDSIFYRGFQHVSNCSRHRDSFVHGNPRFDAIQTMRNSLNSQHIDHLLGKVELREPERPAYCGPFSQVPRQAGDAEMPAEQKAFMRVEREQEALHQLAASMWVVEALKYLNGNKLFPSPASDRLAKAITPLDDPNCVGRNRFRVLDLGGQGSGDWGWHCANQHRNVKVYTIVTKQQVTNPSVKGPSNHRVVSVPHLWKLPFHDNHFDAISARSLHALLKNEHPIGEAVDEYDLCLKECFRILKPGGYLEYMIMDASVAQAGPQGSAMSVEFGFNLKTRGYDPAPTKAFLGRLRKANFVGMKRAWMFLPVGTACREPNVIRETPTPNPPSAIDEEVEAVLGPVGSTADVASISGLLGGWLWEQWMLKLQMEMGREKEKLLDGVGAVIEEGRICGAGWRCLSGWARKPRPAKKEKKEKVKET